MNYEILGESSCPIAEIKLNRDEVVKIERGSMVYTSDVNIEGKLNSNKKGIGGMLGAIGRSITSGESMFITHATGTSNEGKIAVAPSIPGKIVKLDVNSGNQYRLNTGAFLACDDSVTYVMKSQNVGKAIFGGTGGLFVMETEGSGEILVTAFGDLITVEVTSAKPLTIDNQHVVAWDSSLDYNIKIASGAFGFTTGEGLVNEFHGDGKVLIQTRNLRSLAESVSPFLPQSK